jgi:hypothetical protein
MHRLLDERQEVLLHQLTARDVDSDAFQARLGVAATPLRKGLTRLREHPGTDPIDQSKFLGNRDECRGRHGFAVSRPPDQRFEPDAEP